MKTIWKVGGGAIVALALLTGCATMPTASPVMLGGTEVIADAAVGFIAAGPERGQGPEAVVRGFLLAAQSGPTTPTMFAAARQYLTLEAAHTWRPGAETWVLDGTPALDLIETDNPNQVIVRATGAAVAQVSSDGIYQEFRFPVPHTTEYHLNFNGEDWRVAQLADGIIMPAQIFTAAFRYTKLYHPSFDYHTWVPDVRWFPQTTWRTNAVQALIAGPPAFLLDVVQPTVPENAAVALEEISETAGGIDVRVRGWLRDADAFNRALFQAQLAMLFTDGSGTQTVGLADNQGPIPVPAYQLPQLPRTLGPAVAVADGELYTVSGREMIPANPRVDLAELDVTALAAAPGSSDGVVVRNGHTELWWLLPESEGQVENRSLLLEGESLIAPSIDNEGMIWTGEQRGPIQVVDYLGRIYDITANWLEATAVEHLTVAPGGRLVALVTRDDDGTRILVAGVIRDAQGVPIGLAAPVEVGASVREVSAIAWQSDSALAVIGWLAGVHGVYLVGLGGLDAPGGLPRFIPGITEPNRLTASVGTGNMLAIDNEHALHLREATSLWPIVGREVMLVAYPG